MVYICTLLLIVIKELQEMAIFDITRIKKMRNDQIRKNILFSSEKKLRRLRKEYKYFRYKLMFRINFIQYKYKSEGNFQYEIYL